VWVGSSATPASGAFLVSDVRWPGAERHLEPVE
jgi:hypothetical protein